MSGSTAPTSPPPAQAPKRKRDEDAAAEEAKREKKKKRRKSKKPKDIDEGDLNTELGVNNAIGQMDSQLLSDYVAQRTKKFCSDLSTVELEDRYVPAKAVRDTIGWKTDRTMEKLPEFLDHFLKCDLKDAPEQKGAPHTLVVTGAGQRAADLTRQLRKYGSKQVSTGKLFAKHFKLKEQIEFCQRSRMNFGVGTPQRLSDLLENGALSSQHLKYIVVDASHIDAKKRGVLDMKELQVPLIQLLTRQEFKNRYGAQDDRLEVLFF